FRAAFTTISGSLPPTTAPALCACSNSQEMNPRSRVIQSPILAVLDNVRSCSATHLIRLGATRSLCMREGRAGASDSGRFFGSQFHQAAARHGVSLDCQQRHEAD